MYATRRGVATHPCLTSRHTIAGCRCTPSCDDRKRCSSHPTASTTRAEKRSELRKVPCPPWANTAVIPKTHHSGRRGARGSCPRNTTLPLVPLSVPASRNTLKTGRSYPRTLTSRSRPAAGSSTLPRSSTSRGSCPRLPPAPASNHHPLEPATTPLFSFDSFSSVDIPSTLAAVPQFPPCGAVTNASNSSPAETSSARLPSLVGASPPVHARALSRV